MNIVGAVLGVGIIVATWGMVIAYTLGQIRDELKAIRAMMERESRGQ